MATVENKLGNEKTYTPPAWRLLLVYYVLPVAATFLGWLSRYLADMLSGRPEKWQAGSDIVLNAAIAWAILSILFVGFNRDWFAIKINDVSISGQAPLGGRTVLLLSELDVKKISQRTAIDRLFRVWKIWDTRKNKIIINGYFFLDAQMTEILRTLGFDNQL